MGAPGPPPVGQGYRGHVDDALLQIDRMFVQLFALVGEDVAGATHALLSGDREAAKLLVERDEMVDTLYRADRAAGPRAADGRGHDAPAELRYLVAVLRMLPDLERNGDLAEHIARRAARGLGAEMSARSRGLVERMGEVATTIWRVTADAFAERSSGGADAVDELDDELDDLHVTLTAELVAGTMPLPVAIELAMVARFYERFGDHAVNLARRAAVLVAGGAEPSEPPAGRLGREAGQATMPRSTQGLGDLHGVEGRALAEVVAHHEQGQPVLAPPWRRIRPTRVTSAPAASSGVGTSASVHPGRLRPGARWPARGRAPGRTRRRWPTEWPVNTGTRTQVQVTGEVGEAQDLAALVAELLLLVGLARAVVDQRAGHGEHVVGDRAGERPRPAGSPRPRRRR